MQLKLPKQQHKQLSAVLRELNVQQSSELLKGQLTLLPGPLLEQLYTEQPVQTRLSLILGKTSLIMARLMLH